MPIRWNVFSVIAFASLVSLSLLGGCRPPTADQPAGQDGWLTGDAQDKFDTVARHLRGFDAAMVETGYRFTELHWAGHDENWPYADYQIEKLRLAVENGIERRPARAASAEEFFRMGLAPMEEAVAAEDREQFLEQFEALRAQCMFCHLAEEVPFITVVTPTRRLYPTGAD